MNLIDIVKDMSWPDGADCCVQDGCGTVKWIAGSPVEYGRLSSERSPDTDGRWWFRSTFSGTREFEYKPQLAIDYAFSPLSQDHLTTIITRQDWENAQTKKDQTVYPNLKQDGDKLLSTGGITLRQYYAGLAMQGIMSDLVNFNDRCVEFGQRGDDVITQWSIAIADALIEKLEETND